VGPFDLSAAHTIEALTEHLEVVPLAAVVATAFPRREVSAEEAVAVSHGGRLAAVGLGPARWACSRPTAPCSPSSRNATGRRARSWSSQAAG
jgi:hypothetical protein